MLTFAQQAQAIAHARDGGQGLFVWDAPPRQRLGNRPSFREQVRALRPSKFVRLFDRDRARLVATCHGLGLKFPKVEREGSAAQHVFLCGWPAMKALDKAEAGGS